MEHLTDKQIKARAYYAGNAEKIKAKKRAVYVKTAEPVRKKVRAKPKAKAVALTQRIQPALSRAEDLLEELRARKNYF